MAASTAAGELGLSITGLGIQYPPYSLGPDAIDILSKRYHPESPAMKKVLAINRYTGIDQRSSIGNPDHPLVNKPNPPTVNELHEVFMSDGVPLAVEASRKAMAEARVVPAQITHMVSTTCTDSANPGYDHYVAKELGLSDRLEKVLLHGIGCSGGLAALRTAANLCLGHTARGKPARILVLALEVSTTMVRSELESINALQETRIGIALFSDCASAVILSNGIGEAPGKPAIYDLLGWENRVIPDSEHDLGFDVDPMGWKVVLSPRVPVLAKASLQPTYADLLSSLKDQLPSSYQKPADFDWAMHPGGATILSGAESAMGLTPEHMRASYDRYINHGNSSSATIFSVLNRLREKDMDALAPGGKVKEYIVGCAFGPGINVEMCMLKRRMMNAPARTTTGLDTPPETDDSEGPGPGSSAGSDDGESIEGGGEKEEKFINEALDNVELD
ncbi:chalcone synthase [Neurospora intermedia]|uniref:Chalcone synthase n=1 Tax=Neurospora intermedia TaxID=5142 RepID=A0ABR3DA93_NEUIN